MCVCVCVCVYNRESDLQARHIVTVTDRDTGGDALKTIMWPRKGAEIRPGYRAAAGAMATQLLAVLVGQVRVIVHSAVSHNTVLTQSSCCLCFGPLTRTSS